MILKAVLWLRLSLFDISLIAKGPLDFAIRSKMPKHSSLAGTLLKRQLTGLFTLGSPERTIAIYGERLAK